MSLLNDLDRRTGDREGGTRTTSEWTEGEMWTDGEESSRTATGRGEEARRGNSVSQADQPTAEGKQV